MMRDAMSPTLAEDLQQIAEDAALDWAAFADKTFLITGATGLIGKLLVQALCYKNDAAGAGMRLILPVRSAAKARGLFGERADIELIEGELSALGGLAQHVDYVVHAAAPTKSRLFVEQPVETLDAVVGGTRALLELARAKSVEAMVFLSSMEVYGVLDKQDVRETDVGHIDFLNCRSSYSEGKRLAELYCRSYCLEYGTPVVIARLAQTFGPGITAEENRVFKLFADAAIHRRDIVLKSRGRTRSNYVYTADAISGLLFLLQKGEKGEAYNLVGEKTGMTILDTARWIAEHFTQDQIRVTLDPPQGTNEFAPENRMVLDNEKLRALGWRSRRGLKEGYARLIAFLRETALS